MRPQARALEDNANLGIGLMLLAWLVFSFVDTSVKWLLIVGAHAFQLAFMRYVGHFVISTALVTRGGRDWSRFGTSHVGLVLFRAFLLVSATVLNFIALKYVPLTITASIMFSSPIILCALSGPLLGEKVGPWRWFAIMLGFIGVMVVIRPFGEAFHWAMLLNVYNAFSLAFYSILTRRLSGVVATETMQFYMGLLGTVLLLPFAIYTWVPMDSTLALILMVFLGVWGWLGHELLTRAHVFATANTLMPYTYSFLIYLTISSYLVFSYVPDTLTIIGAGIIILSGLIIWKRAEIRGTQT